METVMEKNPQSLHYGKILKRTVARVWDTLSPMERKVVAADTQRETRIAQWFHATVAQEAKAKYESPDYWMNDPSSFKYSKREDPLAVD